jgi:hypothetical protein
MVSHDCPSPRISAQRGASPWIASHPTAISPHRQPSLRIAGHLPYQQRSLTITLYHHRSPCIGSNRRALPSIAQQLNEDRIGMDSCISLSFHLRFCQFETAVFDGLQRLFEKTPRCSMDLMIDGYGSLSKDFLSIAPDGCTF